MGEFIRIIVLHSCSPAFLRTRLLDYSLKTVKVIINEVKTHPIISWPLLKYNSLSPSHCSQHSSNKVEQSCNEWRHQRENAESKIIKIRHKGICPSASFTMQHDGPEKNPKSSAKIYVVHVQNNVTNMIKLVVHSLHIILLCITNQ